MALPSLENRVPTTVRTVSINLESTMIESEPGGPLDTETKSANFTLAVLDQDGKQMPSVGGELLAHLTQDQIDWLVIFMDDMRAQAMVSLPTPP